ncbi:MAG TPA: serine/threonine-protein kinase [Thermoanaerobaculia bacterium]|nr:serine/threonine-protein kinase [Thermoanaerobaculia bacterium]
MFLIGTKIESIRIVSLLGQGGMGSVYAGFDEKLRREVAVKVIRADRLGPLSRARLLREARALSQLNHPNICGIFDYIEGEDSDVLVLERLRGRSLREVLDEDPPLGFPEKLRIAEQIAEALGAAHAKGIVHRDLKMSNVMLTAGNTVKVLDFGLAYSAMGPLTPIEPQRVVRPGEEPFRTGESTLAAWDTEAVLRTEPGKVMGTAACMSPEQIRGEPLTVASDQYSFGLLLQELFTGSSGYAAGTSTELLLEKVRQGETLPVRGVPRPLAALLEALKAPAPEARPSAAETLFRLRWIRSLPARRFRRLAVAAVALAVAGGAAMYTFGLRQERDAAIRARIEAEQFRHEADQVSEFLVNLFRVADPSEDRGSSVTVRETLDRGVEDIRSKLRDQPASQARLLDAIGRTYFSLGLYTRARPLLEEAVALRRSHLGGDHPELALSLRNLATLRQAQGAEAEPLFLEALSIQEKALAPDDPALAATLNNLGVFYGSRGDLSRAEPFFVRALAIREKALGPRHPDVAATLNNLAFVHIQQGHLDKAEDLLRRGLAIREAALPADHPDLAANLEGLALLLSERGRPAESLPLHERVLSIWRKSLGPDHPRIGLVLNNLAEHSAQAGLPDEAERFYRQAVELRIRVLGPDHPDLASTRRKYADFLRSQGRKAEAAALERPVSAPRG